MSRGMQISCKGDDRDVLKLRPGITGPATLKYRLEDEYLANARTLAYGLWNYQRGIGEDVRSGGCGVV